MTKVISGVPYFSQLDNAYYPYIACNVTSLAMCLAFWGIEPSGRRQLEDELHLKAIDNDWNRFTTTGLKKLAESFPGIRDDLTEQGTLQDIRQAIDQNKLCIVHGFFTERGHILVIKGYNDRGFIVNDPNGEWYPWYYDTRVSGEGLVYSKKAITSCCDSWSQGEAVIRYRNMSPEQAEREANSIWLHRIYKS